MKRIWRNGKDLIQTVVAGEVREVAYSPVTESLIIHGERLDDHMQELRELRRRVQELENGLSEL